MPDFAEPLREDEVAEDPVTQFADWFSAAQASEIRAPEAAALATATPDGRPSVRMVLVKETVASELVFFTNYESRKGRELEANPHAALMFFWDPLGRQVRIEGAVSRLADEESATYIRSRPRPSQISALASPQSQVVTGRETLERLVAELSERYEGDELPLPETWGGFRLVPESFEFWQHREDRLHDRLVYRRAGGGWELVRLAP